RLLAIHGRPPDLAEELAGCPFAERCPFVEDACREWEPVLAPAGPARQSACRRAGTAHRWASEEGGDRGSADPRTARGSLRWRDCPGTSPPACRWWTGSSAAGRR